MNVNSAICALIPAWTILCGLSVASAQVEDIASEADRSGAIQGYLSDSKGQPMRVGQAVVFLCDAASGYPLSPETRQPIAEPTARPATAPNCCATPKRNHLRRRARAP
jgi:hypothetical protein